MRQVFISVAVCLVCLQLSQAMDPMQCCDQGYVLDRDKMSCVMNNRSDQTEKINLQDCSENDLFVEPGQSVQSTEVRG